MPLVKAKLQADIHEILGDLKNDTDQDKATDKYAEKLAAAVDAYICSMTITVNGVTTTGSAATQRQTTPVTAKID